MPEESNEMALPSARNKRMVESVILYKITLLYIDLLMLRKFDNFVKLQGCSQVDKASAFGADIRRFESCHPC